MHRVGAALQGGPDVLLGVQVRTDRDGLVGRARMQGAGVVGRHHGNGAQAECVRGPKDAQRDLAAVRHEHGLHGQGG